MTSPNVRSVRRAFEILEVFAEHRRPLSLRELTRELDCPSSSLADLLKTMSNIGCLSFDTESKSYFPTTRLAALGDWVGQELLPLGDQQAALRDLCTETGGTILLGTPNDLEIQYLYVLEGAYSARYGKKPNGRRPLVRSGAGWMLLSQADDDAVDRIWRRSIAGGLIARRDMPFETLKERIAFCRTNGYVAARDSVNPDAAVVAIPLPARPHGRQLVLGIAGMADRIESDVAHIAEILKARVARLAGMAT